LKLSIRSQIFVGLSIPITFALLYELLSPVENWVWIVFVSMAWFVLIPLMLRVTTRLEKVDDNEVQQRSLGILVKRNSSTGFFVGLAGGIVTGIATAIVWYELQLSEMLANIQTLGDKATHQDTSLHLAFIQMAEKGQIDRIIRAHCQLLHNRLEYIHPEDIDDPTLRAKVTDEKKEAQLVVARLEAEGKCLTNR